MLAYKYTNVKIQLAMIKQVVYTYLFNVFLVSPNSIIKAFLINFSKDKENLNSKEKFLKFIEINKDIEDGFYDIFSSNANPLLDEKNMPIVDQEGKNVNEKVTLDYMYLTCLLNKNSQINFDELSVDEIRIKGKQELREIFFDVFLEFVNDIKNKYKIDLDNINLKIQTSGNENFSLSTTSNKNTIEGLINSSFYIETYNDLKKINNYQGSVFTPQLLNDGFQNNSLDTISRLNYNLPIYDPKKNNDGIAEEKKIIDNLNLEGLGIEFFYKIKDKIQIRQACGEEFSKNPVVVSIRDFNFGNLNFEALCGQSFFNWKLNQSYKNLEEFIFFREPKLNKKFEYAESKNGLIIKSQPFDEKKYYGAKLLTKEEIVNLEQKLIDSGDDSGFIALVPTNTLKETEFNNLSLNIGQSLKLFFTVFSENEKTINMSYGDVSKILGVDCLIGSYNLSMNNTFLIENSTLEESSLSYPFTKVLNYKFTNNLDKIEILNKTKTLNGLVASDVFLSDTGPLESPDNKFKGFKNYGILKLENQKFNTNEIFDLYFRVVYNKFKFLEQNSLESALTVGKVETLQTNILKKEGNFLVLMPEITFSEKNKQFLYIEKKSIYEVKLNKIGEEIFKDSRIHFYDAAMCTFFKTGALSEYDTYYSFATNNLKFIKEKYFNKIISIFEKKEQIVEEIKTNFISNNGEYIDFSMFNFGTFKIEKFSSIKNLRSYKNFTDFITYYKNTVQGLAEEIQDRV